VVQNQHDAVGVTPIDGDDHRDVRDVHRDAYHRRCACCDRPEIDIFLTAKILYNCLKIV